MPEIRQYNDKYAEDVRMVCRNTGPSQCFTDKKVENFILSTYCNYYIENEKETCFIAVDGNDTAQGYILCAPDCRRFAKNFRPYIRQAGKSGFVSGATAWGECMITRLFSRRYPAHLHIDINDGFRRSGTGTALMNALTSRLREMNVQGVMLVVGTGNKGGIAFYEHYGFRKLLNFGPGTVMGLRLGGKNND